MAISRKPTSDSWDLGRSRLPCRLPVTNRWNSRFFRVADNTPGTVKSNPKWLTCLQARLPDIGSYGLRRQRGLEEFIVVLHREGPREICRVRNYQHHLVLRSKKGDAGQLLHLTR